MHSADLAVRSRTPKGLDEKRHSFVTQPLQCSHSAREVLISGCAPHVTTFHPDHTGCTRRAERWTRRAFRIRCRPTTPRAK